VVLGGVQPRLARKIRRHVPVGIDGFSLPGVPENLVFETGACFDLSEMIRRLPVQPQAFLRLPVTKQQNASLTKTARQNGRSEGESESGSCSWEMKKLSTKSARVARGFLANADLC
jgi:hypothetical protein